jgi:NCAIR mutase (PurE)-related protein
VPQPDIRSLLQSVRDAEVSIDEALRRLGSWPVADLGHSRLDLQRELRCGQPEVVYGAGKSIPELLEIADALVESSGALMVTRIGEEAARALLGRFEDGEYHAQARLLTVDRREPRDGSGRVLVVSAGTSDRAVAEEAHLTARMMGARVEHLPDVGVAGIHRLMASVDELRSARVLIVVAGMEGALPSVVGGLVDRPVIAVPTSVGYGASFGGLAALLAMLNSCAAGITVVNVDNGFGAGCAAARINRTMSPDDPENIEEDVHS